MLNSNRIALLEKFITEQPNDPFNRYALAMEYYESVPTKSLEILDELVIEAPEYLPTYYKLAHLYWNSHDLEKAKLVFEKGIELAKQQSDQKAIGELNSSLMNLEFELD